MKQKKLAVLGVSISVLVTSGVLYLGANKVEVSGQETTLISGTTDEVEFSEDTVNADKQVSTSKTQTDLPYSGKPDENLLPKRLSASEYAQYSVYGSLPKTLQGTAIPNLYLDADGNLVRDESLKNFFEYFLTAAREEGNARILSRMQEYMSLVLEGQAQEQGLEVLDNYLNYRMQLDQVVSRQDIVGNGSDQLSALRETLDRRKDFRRETLGEDVATAMFGSAEKYEDYAVNLMSVRLDNSLSDLEKETLIKAYEEDLPEKIQKRVRYEREETSLKQQVEVLKLEGGKEAEIYALRSSFYGEETADRLAYLEAKPDNWVLRVNDFKQSKENILASVMLSDEQKRQQINEIRDRDFNELEKVKMAWQELKPL
jgi:lipase chaperone LimK